MSHKTGRETQKGKMHNGKSKNGIRKSKGVELSQRLDDLTLAPT